MLEFTLFLYDTDAGVGRSIEKDYKRPVIPRIGETINLGHTSVTVTDVWHDFQNPSYVEVKCENVTIEFIRRIYAAGGWDLFDTSEEDLASDAVTSD